MGIASEFRPQAEVEGDIRSASPVSTLPRGESKREVLKQLRSLIMNSAIRIVFLLLLCASGTGYGQYMGEQVMERSFEQTDFFFTPYRLVPYGIGTFSNSVAGVLDDPLLNLHVNPAYLPRDSMHASYGYVDFRSAKEIRDESNIYYPYPIFTVRTIEAASFIPYPRFYINTRRELEPVISAAYLFHPTEGALKNLSLGASYQLVSQDEKYYP